MSSISEVTTIPPSALTPPPQEYHPQWLPTDAVTTQPSSWQPGTTPQQGLPPVMAHLATLDIIEVQQQFCTGKTWDKTNRYQILDAKQRNFMLAKEEPGNCTRWCCGTQRRLTLTLIDTVTGFPVIRLNRPLRCAARNCGFCCRLQIMEIESPLGTTRGMVKEKWHCCYPKYKVYDVDRNVVVTIAGQCCYCKCFTDMLFTVYEGDVDRGSHQIGQITKRWNGFSECFGGVNNFSVKFPREMDVMKKILLLGATFLVDFNYFESAAQELMSRRCCCI